ncbi:MAG TPA: PEP/pyruvate-binding domain-containing protein [Candidatus Dormibacteraeota bacterium]|nr:PEP/pyruvate-binding domain-containing protein [Candidatus Dormibacteraeota bacterium]
MSEAAVRKLRDVRMADVAEVGGKAASLGELLGAGVRVPDGVVLTAGAADLTAADRRSLLFVGAGNLGIGPFAVRSSGIAEDGAERSYAGIYESVLDVSADDLAEAAERCLASAGAARVAEYEPATGGSNGRMAVIVQRMVTPAAAGVVLTADPINGDRRSCIVTAVRGTGERLVSGAALGDEWVVQEDVATARRQPEHAIDRGQAMSVANEARRIAAARGDPQDIEWAIDAEGTLWILQARPMTALAPDVSWDAPAPGAYNRAYRFGEWIGEPVTPLFESWLLSTMEARLHARLQEWIGQHAPRPYHVVVNGWYFYSINFISPAALARSLPDVLWHLIRSPRRVAGLIPPLLRHSFPVFEREWREDLLPRYRAAVAAAEGRVETLPVSELPAVIDELAGLAGDYFGSIAALAGAAYKMEINLARFFRGNLASALDGSHLPLLAGFGPPADPGRHAVASLDWWHAPSPHAMRATRPPEDHLRLVKAREAAEEAAFRTLASSPRRLRAFRRLLADAQHLVLVREEQVRDLTLAWPAMRRAVLRIGEALAAHRLIAEPADVFFLTRDETLEALGQGGLPATVDVAGRRAKREEQARLVPPLFVGRVNPMLTKMWYAFPRLIGAVASDTALVSGAPASPGRATGPVRVIRGPQQFDELLPGEILVAPLTAPAWTPLFTRAAAVVTDVGSAASHASIIAREYGIPAVVGCGDATARLRTGMRVTVDGSTGNVEPE